MKGKFNIHPAGQYCLDSLEKYGQGVLEEILANCPVITIPENPTTPFEISVHGRFMISVRNPEVRSYNVDETRISEFHKPVVQPFCPLNDTTFLDMRYEIPLSEESVGVVLSFYKQGK